MRALVASRTGPSTGKVKTPTSQSTSYSQLNREELHPPPTRPRQHCPGNVAWRVATLPASAEPPQLDKGKAPLAPAATTGGLLGPPSPAKPQLACGCGSHHTWSQPPAPMLSAASCKPLPPSVAAVNSNTTTSVTTVSSGSTTFGSTECQPNPEFEPASGGPIAPPPTNRD